MAVNNSITVSAGIMSYIGCVRANNEDNFFVNGALMELSKVDRGDFVKAAYQSPTHLFAVADGMGGLNGGEFASYATVKALDPFYAASHTGDMGSVLREFVRKVSRNVIEDAKQRKITGGGATLAMVLIKDNLAHVLNVGDSRVYILRMGRLIQISFDHTAVYQQLMRGELTRAQLQTHSRGHAIYQYIGMPEEKMTGDYGYYRSCALCNGDRFVICTDGVSDLIAHEQLEEIVSSCADPAETVKALVTEAAELGGKDNATCIVIDVSAPQLPIQTLSDLTVMNMTLNENTTMERTAQ